MSRFYVYNSTNQHLHIHQVGGEGFEMELPEKGFGVFESQRGQFLSGHAESGSFFITFKAGTIEAHPYGKFKITIKGYHEGESYAEVTER